MLFSCYAQRRTLIFQLFRCFEKGIVHSLSNAFQTVNSFEMQVLQNTHGVDEVFALTLNNQEMGHFQALHNLLELCIAGECKCQSVHSLVQRLPSY